MGSGAGSVIFTTAAGATAFWLTTLAFIGMDLRLATRGLTGRLDGTTEGDHDPRNSRAGGLRLLVIAEVVGLALAPIRQFLLPGRWTLLVVGLTIAWIGIVVRFFAKRTLGRFFVAALIVQDGHRVVTSGPYAVVRHPGYAGMVLVLLGLAVASANTATMLFLVAIPLVVVLRAIPSEEAMLEAALGSEYARYRSGTARLIPGVW